MSHKRSFRIIVHVGPATMDQAVEILDAFRQTGQIVTLALGVETAGSVDLDPCDECADTERAPVSRTMDRGELMAPASRRIPAVVRPKARAQRVNRTLTLSPRTEALLESWAAASGIARGRIVDMALDFLQPCPACRGRGTVDGPHGDDTERCLDCRGERIVPA